MPNLLRLYIIIICTNLISCSSTEQKQTASTAAASLEVKNEKPASKYLRWVGDSKYNPEIDDPNYELCYSENQVRQYFNFSKGMRYKGEKQALVKYFTDKYQAVKSEQSGLIRIRFIVNCNGQTGRFRIISSDENYQEQAFDNEIVNQLLSLTKSLDGWQKQPDDKFPRDYYQYLIFKIKNGDLIEIMP